MAGIDFAAEPSSTERVQSVGTYEFEFGSNQIAELQDWLVHPESNHGWVLVSQAEDTAFTARRFATREHPQPNLRPTLVLEVSPGIPVPAPVIRSVAFVSGEARVVVAAEAGVRYTLESTPGLPAAGWTIRGDTVSTNRSVDLVLTDGSDPGQERFFRVRATR